MTTRAFRFQADVDASGQFVSGLLYDQQTVTDAITDVVTGVTLIGPTILTNQTHPALFISLNALTDKTDERVQIQRDAFLASVKPGDAVVAK